MRWGPYVVGSGVSTAAAGVASVLLAAVPLPAAAGPGVDLALVNVARLPPTAVRMLQHEASSILDEGGLPATWAAAGQQTAPDGRALRVILVATDYPRRGPRAGGPLAVLGAVAPDAPRPAVWIYTRALARVLGVRWPAEAASVGAQRALGLAMGRVAVHEIVHVLSPRTGHTANGLMASRLPRRHLVGPRPGLELPPPARWLLLTGRNRGVDRPSSQGGGCLLVSGKPVQESGEGS